MLRSQKRNQTYLENHNAMNIKLIKHKIITAWKALTSDHVILITMDRKAMEGMITEEDEGVGVIMTCVGHVPYTQMRVLEGVYDSYVEPNIEKEAERFLEEAEKIENQ